MQNQYPNQGYPPPQQGWNQQPPPGQYNQPPQGQWGQPQQGYGGPPPPPQGYPPQQYPPQQGGWGQAPSQGQYPPPQQGGYGQTPPPGQYNQYGAPPPNQGWGQQGPPPPQGGYGPPPGQVPYGSPAPPQGYGAPPPGQFGAPPPGQFGPMGQPSPGYGPIQTANIDMSADVEGIRKAMKGFGTNEKQLIGYMAKKDPFQINTLRETYNQRLMRNLITDIEKETTGYFEKGLVQIARGPLAGDCHTLYTAIKGLGTVEDALDDVLVGRTNADLNAIKQEYQRIYKKSLEADLRGDLSAGTEQMYMIITSARRAEDSIPPNPADVDRDATELNRSIGNMINKNAIAVCELLFTRNDAQIRAIAQQYQTRFRTPLAGALKSSFSGHMESALLLLVDRANNRAEAEAVRLEESMAGLGTKDELLVQRVVRCHWDQGFMRAVSDAYKRKYGKSLVKRIEGETRGDYEKLMVACVQ